MIKKDNSERAGCKFFRDIVLLIERDMHGIVMTYGSTYSDIHHYLLRRCQFHFLRLDRSSMFISLRLIVEGSRTFDTEADPAELFG